MKEIIIDGSRMMQVSKDPIKNNINFLAFRPQHIYLTNENDFDLELKVFGIENLGKEIIIICEFGDDKIRVITEKFNSEIGSMIKLKIDKENTEFVKKCLQSPIEFVDLMFESCLRYKILSTF